MFPGTELLSVLVDIAGETFAQRHGGTECELVDLQPPHLSPVAVLAGSFEELIKDAERRDEGSAEVSLPGRRRHSPQVVGKQSVGGDLPSGQVSSTLLITWGSWRNLTGKLSGPEHGPCTPPVARRAKRFTASVPCCACRFALEHGEEQRGERLEW